MSSELYFFHYCTVTTMTFLLCNMLTIEILFNLNCWTLPDAIEICAKLWYKCCLHLLRTINEHNTNSVITNTYAYNIVFIIQTIEQNGVKSKQGFKYEVCISNTNVLISYVVMQTKSIVSHIWAKILRLNRITVGIQ